MSAGLAAVSAPRSRTGGAHDDDGGPRSPSTLFNVEIRTQFQINSSAAARLPNAGVLFFFLDAGSSGDFQKCQAPPSVVQETGAKWSRNGQVARRGPHP